MNVYKLVGRFRKLPESPRWLLSQKNVLGARQVLAAIARGNGVPYEDSPNNNEDDDDGGGDDGDSLLNEQE